jgi:hypothetical protein
VGTSADGSTTSTITQQIKNVAFMQNPPTNPFTVKGGFSLGGNVSITNPVGAVSVWSGGAASISGSATTANASGTTSSSSGINNDIMRNDASLSSLSGDQFFQNFFQSTKASVKSKAQTYFNNSTDTNYSSNLDGLTGQLIWIDQTSGEARVNSNITIGSPTAPVILVINGDFHLNGNATVYGVVYIAQDWNNSGGGTLTIHGTGLIEGNFSGTGTPNIIYDQSVMNQVVGTLGTVTKIPGSWQDF